MAKFYYKGSGWYNWLTKELFCHNGFNHDIYVSVIELQVIIVHELGHACIEKV